MNVKKKGKYFFIIGILTMVFVCMSFFSGCIDEKSKFIGVWQNKDGGITMTFESDNKVTITGNGFLGFVSLTGTYSYSIANQKITFSSGDIGITLNYSFPQSNQLILSNDQGASVIFTKE